jgi:hypothetical protein
VKQGLIIKGLLGNGNEDISVTNLGSMLLQKMIISKQTKSMTQKKRTKLIMANQEFKGKKTRMEKRCTQ